VEARGLPGPPHPMPFTQSLWQVKNWLASLGNGVKSEEEKKKKGVENRLLFWGARGPLPSPK